MNYCKECVMPDTKPGLTFTNGVCSACNNHKLKKVIDWDLRGDLFYQLIDDNPSHGFYDCIVPVSGGKDSFIQIKKAIDYGLQPLAISVEIGLKTKEGVANLKTISNLCDLIVFTPEQGTHKKLIKIGLKEYGDPDYFSHGMIYNYPIRLAHYMNIPLVLYGEDPSFEYVGQDSGGFDAEWFYTHAITGYNKIISKMDLLVEYKELYKIKSRDSDMVRILNENYLLPFDWYKWGVKPVFLGYYFFWDSVKNYEIAKGMGFIHPESRKEGTYRSWVGIDENINRIHQYIKVLKFGYGRTTDHACEDIRNNRITREKGINLVRNYDLDVLSGKYIMDLSDYLDEKYVNIEEDIEKQRNERIWYIDLNKWKLRGWIGDY